MVNLKQRRKLKKILYSNFTIGILVVLVFVLARASWNAYQNVKFTRANVEESRTELESLRDRSSYLRKETQELSSEEGLEREIRERLPVAKEGERVIIVVDDEEENLKTEETEELSWWGRVLDWIRD